MAFSSLIQIRIWTDSGSSDVRFFPRDRNKHYAK